MGAYGDAVQRTVFTTTAMIRALRYVTFNTLIFFGTFHGDGLLSGIWREGFCPPSLVCPSKVVQCTEGVSHFFPFCNEFI